MPIDILMPALSPTMTQGTLAKWLIKEGDRVSSGQIIAEIETDKATMEFEIAEDGLIERIYVAEGTSGIAVNTPIAAMSGEFGHDAAVSRPTTPKVATFQSNGFPNSPMPEAKTVRTRVYSSPLARRFAEDRGLPLDEIVGSGPNGRIVVSDVRAFLRDAPPPSKPGFPGEKAIEIASKELANPVASLFSGRDYTEIALTGMRRAISTRLSASKQTIPHFYLRRSFRLDALQSFRSDLNRSLEAKGIKLSVNDFIIKACAIALQAVPEANSVWAGDRILRFSASDIAVAVAVEDGLFTPILRDAQSKRISEISAEMKDLAKRARSKSLFPEEYLGGSCAISNLGMMGIESFDAIINPPHSSILAVGSAVRQPVVAASGAIESATVVSLTLSADHRVIDGAIGAEYLRVLIEQLETPALMLA